MKKQTALSKIGMLMIVVGTILTITYLIFDDQIIRTAELYLSSDQQLTSNGKRLVASTYCFGTVWLLGAGFVLRKAQNATWRNKIKEVFLEEPVAGSKPVQFSPGRVFVISVMVGLFLMISLRLSRPFASIYSFLYAKDRGLLDLSVSLAMLVSAVLIFITVWRIWKADKVIKSHFFLPLFYLFLAVLLVAYAGEETSWGQDFFKWQTPELFSGNLENQTNVHNYFNPYFRYIYAALTLVFIVVLFSAWLEFNQYWQPYNRLILPHPSLIGLSLLIAFVAFVWYREQELLEEMVAAFVLFYSLRIFTLFRSGNLLMVDPKHPGKSKTDATG
jgi:hypothetical protein